MPAPIPFTMRPAHTRGADAPPPPPPGVFEGLFDPEIIGATVSQTRADIPGHIEEERVGAYTPIITALVERGERADRYYIANPAGLYTSAMPTINYDLVFADAQRLKLAGLPATRAAFDQLWQGGMARRQAREGAVAARGGIAARLVGGAAGGMTDPINAATMAFGGGARWWTQLLIEAAINAGVEAGETPLINLERQRQGRPGMTGDEMLANVGIAAAGGVAFRGLAMLPGATRAGFERAVTAGWDRLPAPLQQRWSARAELPLPDQDALMADMAETLIGPDNLSEAERAAAALIRRTAQADAASPFAPSGAATELHPRLLSEAMQTILDENPVRPTARLPEGGSRAARLRTTTAITSRTVQPGDAGVPAQQRFKNRVRRQESGGDDTARNPRSSAAGRYQFTDGTWLAYYRRRFGNTGESEAQILARKRDGALQERLMDDLTADNAAFLRSRGEAVSEGNLYLVHFAGQGGAGKLFNADPVASARSVLGDAVVNANPHLAAMTAGEVIAWAHRAMGAAPSRRGGARPEVRVGEDAQRAALQDEIDAIDARLDALRERPPGGPTASRLLEGEESPRASDFADVLDPIEDMGLQARDPDLPELPPFMPELAALVADKGRSLNDIDGLASALGVPGEQVRAGLDQLVADGTILRRRDTGRYMRKPPAPARGPRSLLEFIADRGGMRDHGGELAHMDADRWHREAPFRRKLIREDAGTQASMLGAGPRSEHGGDAMFEAAIDAGYFPELMGGLSVENFTRATYADLPDIGTFYAAIRDELHGEPRYSIETRKGFDQVSGANESAAHAGRDQFTDEPWEEARTRFREQWADHGNDPADLPDAYLDMAEVHYARGEAATPEAAVQLAIAGEIAAIRQRAFDETADAMYGRAYDPFDPNWEERLAADAEFQREFERAAALAVADADGGGGRAAEPRDPGAGGADGADAVRAAEDGYAQGQRLATLEPAERAPFLDPEGPAAQAQAASLEHDARMAVGRGSLEEFNAEGNERFLLYTGPDGQQAHIHLVIGSDGRAEIAVDPNASTPNRFGPGMLRDAARLLKQLYPEVRQVWGNRESGAGPGRVQVVDLDKPDPLDLGAATDPAIAARQAQEAALGAEAPLRGDVAQESTLGFGLFGAADGVRLDAEGEARPLKDLLDELDAEAAELRNLRDCLD